MGDLLGVQELVRGLRRENSRLKDQLQDARLTISLETVCCLSGLNLHKQTATRGGANQNDTVRLEAPVFLP